MEIKRCSKGHFYDAEANSFCPQCAAEQGFGAGSMEVCGATEPVGGIDSYGATEPTGSMGGIEDFGPTEPVGGMDSYGPTEPVGGMGNGAMGPIGGLNSADIGATMPLDGSSGFTEGNFSPNFSGVNPRGLSGAGGVEDYDSVTVPITPPGGIPGFMPVVGWLVCVEGAARGSDYRIRAGYNYIGRAEHMDICVRGDNTIGRERHALIAYDQEERVFFFGPADGKSIVRLNGKMVMTPQQIKLHDVLTVGTTKLLFVPLCGEGFDWNGNEGA